MLKSFTETLKRDWKIWLSTAVMLTAINTAVAFNYDGVAMVLVTIMASSVYLAGLLAGGNFVENHYQKVLEEQDAQHDRFVETLIKQYVDASIEIETVEVVTKPE